MDKKKIITISILVVLVISVGGYFTFNAIVEAKEEARIEAKIKLDKENLKRFKTADKSLSALFSDPNKTVVIETINANQIKDALNKVKKVANKKQRKEWITLLDTLSYYIDVRVKIDSLFVEQVLKSDTSEEIINATNESFNKIKETYKPVLQPKIDNVNTQFNQIKEVKGMLVSYYTEDGVTLAANIRRQDYDLLKAKLDALAQRDIADAQVEKLNEMLKVIEQREYQEEIERQKKEAERQRAIQAAIEESQRIERENAAIAASNYILQNVPMINQKDNRVFNGCEAASLLMALQYKGYNIGMTLAAMADAMPKHATDPNLGFIHSIYDVAPSDVPHWIAPGALARFGQTFYAGVADISGASPAQLKAELDAGNPVIVYATYGYYRPNAWVGDAPKNLHVMTLVGYNRINSTYIINDPWANRIMVSQQNFETVFQQVGSRAVVVR